MRDLNRMSREELLLTIERVEQERAGWEKKEKALIEAIDDGQNNLRDVLEDEYNEKALEAIVKECGLKVTKKDPYLWKFDLAIAIGKYFRRPEVLTSYLCPLPDPERDALEKCVSYHSGWYTPECPEEEEALQYIVDSTYFMAKKDGHPAQFRVPADICRAFDSLMTKEFAAELPLRSWVCACTWLIYPFYALIPLHDFADQVRVHPVFARITDQKVRAVLDSLPERDCCFTWENDSLLAEGCEDPDFLASLKKSQANLPWHHFSPEEVWEYVKFGFPKSEPRLQSAAAFLTEHFDIPEDVATDLVKDMWTSANEKSDLSDFDLPDVVEKRKKREPTSSEIKAWDSYRIRINRNTHNCMFRGMTYNQAVAFQRKRSGNPEITSYVIDG